MNKSEFIAIVKEKGEYKSNVDAEKAINAFTQALTSVLEARDSLSLIGFANFSTAVQKGKTGTVPGTTKTYTTQDKVVPKMKFGKTVLDRVAAGK